ncbi:MAG: carboxypeptidase regulatory-like domain-containing protein [Myxococcota bacterium]
MILWLAGCGPEGAEGWIVRLSGRVVDEDGAPIEGAEVALAGEDGTPIASPVTDGDGAWSMPVYGTELDGNRLVAHVRAEGMAEGKATFEVNLQSPEVTLLRAGPFQTFQTTERRLATVQLARDVEVATVAGRVVSAIDDGSQPGYLPIVLQRGWNASIGDEAVDATVTGGDGTFFFQAVPAGVYTVSFAGDGTWGPARFPALLTGEGGSCVGVVGPPIVEGQMRASVHWGPTPGDLDLHLSAPLKGGLAGEDGTGQYHVWTGDPRHPEREDEATEAALVNAASQGFGPETVEIYSAPGHGEIRLSVLDNDNQSDADSTALADSGAVMQVWYGLDYPRYYTVSPGEVATYWRPVHIDTESLWVYAVEAYESGVDPTDASAF